MEKTKKTFKLPHTYVIIFTLIVMATLMTFIVPAGQYVRVENAQGVKVVDPTQFSYIENSPVNPLEIPVFIVDTFSKTGPLLFLALFSGAAFHMLSLSGALSTAIGKLANRFSSRIHIFIPILTLTFALTCLTQGPDPYMALAPLLVVLAMALGLDSITGVGIILLGGSIGFSTGTLNPSTTVIAQQIGELPLYSGLEFRAICFIVFYIVTTIFLVRYALKVKKDPTKSPMYQLDKTSNFALSTDISADQKMDWRKIASILALVISVISIAFGGILWGWGLSEMAAVFFTLAIVVGLFSGFTPSEIAVYFLDGCRKMLGAVIIIGLARTIGGILTAGQIIDTIVKVVASSLNLVPQFLQAPAMMIANMLINVAIPSGSGQAAAVMPIMIPVADFVGMSRQVAVLAFNFGDGFCNYVIPTAPGLMGILGAASIPYENWMKFMWKLFLVWIVVGSIMLMIAQAINLGPM